tara:strand:+ start:680 stop:1249 length:570 start_codon:yes stop_codon:yes gene_type:complete
MASVLKVDSIEPSTASKVTLNSSGQILEIVSSVCDGSTVNGYTFENVTEAQEFTTTFTDVTGSSISYTPPSQATQVAYEFNYQAGFTDNHSINSLKFFIDSDEILYARSTYTANSNFSARLNFKWVINIGGTASTNTGRVATWTSAKTLKIQGREYGSSNEGKIHHHNYWEGSGTGGFSMPTLTITAIR